MIKELCGKLKQKRRDLGYSIEYVVERTKLHPSMIRDIEEGNLIDENPVYVKGFIKIYAAFLKVDMASPSEAVDPTDSSLKAKDNKIKRISNSVFLDRIKGIIKKIFSVIKNKISVILFAVFFLWLLFTLSSFIIRKIGKLFTGSKSVQRQERKEGSQAAPVSLEGEELVVTLTAKKNCFLKVIVDGKLLFDGQLTEGAVETWRGDKEIEMKIRDGSAIALEVNGKDIPTLTSLRKPIKSLKITSSGIVVDK